MKRALAQLILVCCVLLTVAAKDAQPMADDPELEKRVTKLSQELRCLVCQNETLADSRADLADDLRRTIREQMKAGKSDKEIVAYLTERYGDFVLYRPPVKPATYLLWFGPFILLVTAPVFLFRYLRHRSGLITERPLSVEERERAAKLLGSNIGKEGL
jgi:cytochrome c-type biogenesis protein CcmH